MWSFEGQSTEWCACPPMKNLRLTRKSLPLMKNAVNGLAGRGSGMQFHCCEINTTAKHLCYNILPI